MARTATEYWTQRKARELARADRKRNATVMIPRSSYCTECGRWINPHIGYCLGPISGQGRCSRAYTD